MNTEVFPDKTVKCRKRHQCRVCGQFIQIGETAISRSGIESGDGPWTIHMHPECEVLTRDWDCDDWECVGPGDVKRPEIPPPAKRFMKKDKEQSGVDLIAAERTRQIEKEGWSESHDDSHTDGALAEVAALYAQWSVDQVKGVPRCGVPRGFPWEEPWWKPSDDPIRNLVKAGALIAAEIDRLNRLKIPDGIRGISGLIPSKPN